MQPQPRDDELFDTLCILRDNYARLGTLDRAAGLSVDAALVYGEGLMRIARRRDEHASRRNTASTECRRGSTPQRLVPRTAPNAVALVAVVDPFSE